MFKHYCITILFFITFTTYGISQNTYHRVLIDLKDRDISILNKIGIETDHGKLIPFRSLENDFNDEEIKRIEEAGFNVEIKIEDVVSYYQNPNRPSEFNVEDLYRSHHCSSEIEVRCQISDFVTPKYYSGGSMGGYKTYSELLPALDSMALLYPELITNRINIDTIKTHEGNTVFYLKISDNPNDNEADEPQILYTSLHHAREPNGLAQMLFYMWYLLENYDSDPDIKALVDNTEMYFIPVVNPDGYLINESISPNGGGLWRKNAKRLEDSTLVGVDLNRNYGYEWGIDNNGSSPNPNSQTYRGEAPFSEPETQIVKSFCESKNIGIALNYHTFGNLLIHPWGFNDQPTDEDQIFKNMASDMTKENCYTVGTGTETVGYVVNGDSDDWMYGEEDTKPKIYAMTPEVGPSFWPPASDIINLNKACVEMNLNTARLALNSYEVKRQSDFYINNKTQYLVIDLLKTGLANIPIDVFVRINSDKVTSGGLDTTLNLNISESISLNVPLSYSNDIKDGDSINVTVSAASIGNNLMKEFTYIYYDEGFTNILVDDVTEQLDNWNTTSLWGQSSTSVTNGQFSITDSPNGIYRRNATSYIQLKDPVDLTDALQAYLSYDVLWDIEDNFDFATIELSTNGIDFNPLCGVFTEPGSSNQIEDQPVYDGKQLSWVNEFISLEEYIGNPEVYIRFTMNSDGFVEGDGIYIDNFKVNVVEKSTSNLYHINEDLVLYPNPVGDMLHISTSDRQRVLLINILDASGKVLSNIINDSSVDMTSFDSGLYFIEVQTDRTKLIRPVVKM